MSVATASILAPAIQVYFRFGYIPAPGDRLGKRKLTQEVGEEFILWADEYFSPPTDPSKPSRLNQVDIPRKDMYDNFLEYIGPSRRTYYQPRTFKTKLIKYCEVKVRNSEFSHDVAIALQSHLNRVHDASARDGRGLDGNRKKRDNR